MENNICIRDSFIDIKKRNFLYVDKTEYIWKLTEKPNGAFIMSRPPMFGKTLFISTLKTFFQGNRKAFEGLAIFDNNNWQQYSIIHLDFNDYELSYIDQEYTNIVEKRLNEYLLRKVLEIAEESSIVLRETSNSSSAFCKLIRDIKPQKPLVILVDGYDMPVLKNALRPQNKTIAKVLQSFYSQILTTEREKHFVFLTGISSCFQSLLFPEWGNLTDITMHPDYATMFGYTQKEFEKVYSEHIDFSIAKMNISHELFMKTIKRMYGGYKFEPNSEEVYSPNSVNRFFYNNGDGREELKFRCYSTNGVLSLFLAEYLEKVSNKSNIPQHDEPIPKTAFERFELKPDNLRAMLQQAGCFTIVNSTRNGDEILFRLKTNNDEMRRNVKNVYDIYLRLKDERQLQFMNIIENAEMFIQSKKRPNTAKHQKTYNYFDSCYQQYMNYIENKYPFFYNVTRAIEKILIYTPGIQIVLPYFKMVVPTINTTDYQPYIILLSAIADCLYYKDYNKLCAFAYIAGIRSQQIEKAGNNYIFSEKGRNANRLDRKSVTKRKREEAKILFPQFEIMHQQKIKFGIYYRNQFLNHLLDAHASYLEQKINTIAEKYFCYRKVIEEIQEYLSGMEIHMKTLHAKKLRTDIIEKLLKVKPLKKQIQDKYRRWSNPKMPNELILLDILGDFPVSILEATSWKKFPWPTDNSSLEKSIKGYQSHSFNMEAFLDDIKNNPIEWKIDLSNYSSDHF